MGTALSITLILNLAFGASGPEVTTLQQMLNRDIDTRIAPSGPGSPGNETVYFGLLTKNAVIRFQEKHSSEILAPAGLTKGSGYVGSYTRSKLNALSAVAKNTSAQPPATPSSTTTQAATNDTSTASQNPNLQNLDKAFAALDMAAARGNISAADIAVVKAQIKKQASATTSDMRAAFLAKIQRESQKTTQSRYPLGKALAALEQAFDNLFMPEHALAGIDVPFGGALLWAEPCTCTAGTVWKIIIEPLPPTYVVDLDYVIGSQAFASYNTPFTEELLGFYAPGVEVCWEIGTPCWLNPGEGLITPVVGSSLL